ncbi:MAG: DUF1822 family protein [Microcoleaceae cyanobacterium]
MNQDASNSEFRQDLINYNFYPEAQASWNVNDLIVDLETIKKKWPPIGEGLTKFHKQYLLMVLVGKQLPDMVAELEDLSSVESLRTKLSNDKKKKGIHFCLEKLLKQEIGNPQNIIFHLFNSKYRKQLHPPNTEKETGLLIRIPDDVSAKQLLEIENKVRAITGCPYIRIVEIKMGSIILLFKGSQSACEQIESLYQQGLLSERLGVRITDVEIIPSQVNLTEWFEGIFTRGWQTVEELLTPQQLRPAFFSEQVQRAKQIDLEIDLIEHTVILVVDLTRENQESMIVNLKVFPTSETDYLPPELKLTVLSEGDIVDEVITRSSDRLIQCEFDAEIGDKFSVTIELGEAVVTEEFRL